MLQNLVSVNYIERRVVIAEGIHVSRLKRNLHPLFGRVAPRSRQLPLLARAPQEYAWEQVWLTDDAVVGVWPAGESIEVIVERDGRRTVSLRVLALQRVNHHFVNTNLQPSGRRE